MGFLSAGKHEVAADFSKDSEEMKRERKGFWLTGAATGPDTTMGVLWGAVIIVVASSDATCHPFDGRSSGADGDRCTNVDFWNQTYFEEVGGNACLGRNLVGDPGYQTLTTTACQSAFAAYRSMPSYTSNAAFTCNCSGRFTDHTYLGLGGIRPSNTFNTMSFISLAVIGLCSMPIGTFADFSSHRVLWWKVMALLAFICNACMMITGPNYLWVASLVFGGLTACFTDLVTPIRNSFYEDITTDQASRGYIGAMRQFSGYTAQVVYAIIVAGMQMFADPPKVTQAIIIPGICAVWYAVAMPYVLGMLRNHPAKRTDDGSRNKVALTFQELGTQWAGLKKYPEAVKYLIAHMLAQYGGPLFVTLVSTYAPSQMERDGLEITIVAGVVLLFGMPCTMLLAKLMRQGSISFRICWAVVLTLSVAIGALIPLLASGPDIMSYIAVLILAGLLASWAISWFYAIGWPSFISLVPPSQAAGYSGIFSFCNAIVQPWGFIIYTAVVQATNSHRLAWGVATCPFLVVSLGLMMSVNFEKGARDAGHKGAQPADASAPQLTGTTNA